MICDLVEVGSEPNCLLQCIHFDDLTDLIYHLTKPNLKYPGGQMMRNIALLFYFDVFGFVSKAWKRRQVMVCHLNIRI